MKRLLRLLGGTSFAFLALYVSVVLLAGIRAGGQGGQVGTSCLSGDMNGDGSLDISDPIHLLSFLFQGGAPPVACADDSALLSLNAALNETNGILKSMAESRDCPGGDPAQPGDGVFMKLGDIRGDSTEPDFKGWIVCRTVSSNVTVTVDRTGGAGTGKPTFDDLMVRKTLDQASVRIALAAATGDTIPEVDIHLTRLYGTKRVTYLMYSLRNVIISHHALESPSTCAPVEAVALNFAQIKWTYAILDEKGASTGSVTGGYDVLRNIKV